MHGGSVGSARTVSAVLLMSVVAALAPTAPVAGAPTDSIVVSDGSGDVYLGTPTSNAAAPNSAGLDITEAKIYDPSGEGFRIEIRLSDMSAESATAGQTQGVYIVACFTWNEKLYGARVKYTLNPSPSIQETTMGLVDGACDPTAVIQFTQYQTGFSVGTNGDENLVSMLIERDDLGKLAQGAPPAAGDSIKDFRVFAFDGRRLRFDAAPNTGVAEGAIVLTMATANLDLKARVDKNVAGALKCAGQPGLNTYAIEAGGKRGVPVVLENPLTGARTAELQVRTVRGEDWKPAMLPRIEVPAASDAGTGNLTVNVIVDTPATTKHKQCSTLRVSALDPAAPAAFGETTFNVIAVNPPAPALKKLYAHTIKGPASICNINDFWLNTLETDPDDGKREIFMGACRETAAVSTAQAVVLLMIDVNPSHDLVINTSAVGAKAVATVGLRSDGLPTTADLQVTVVSGRSFPNQLGVARKTVTLTSTPSTVTLEVPIDFTRDEVATGDPSRIVDAREGIGMFVGYSPRDAGDGIVPAPVAGRVFFLPQQTSLELPIFATIKRNVNDPGAGGSLLSIAAQGALPDFAAPGALRLFNFTILNEGAKPDVAVTTASLGGVAGWTTQVFPTGPITLAPGEHASVQVGVTPRVDAEESERGILDVVVTSQQDPTARASISKPVIASREAGIPFEQAPERIIQSGDKGLLPAAGWPAALAVLVLVGWAVRRRD